MPLQVNPLGEVIRTLMSRRQLTGVQLAEEVGLSATSVSRIVTGHSKPKQVTLTRLMKRLCVAPDEEQLVLRAFAGLKSQINEEPLAEDSRNAVVERERVERWLEARTQAITFKNAVARELEKAGIGGLNGDGGPTCIIVGFPEEIAELRMQNPRLSFAEQQSLKSRQREADDLQMSLFDSLAEKEKSAAAELFPQAEELLYRNFHRALKARCMAPRNAVPLQIVRRHTYITDEAKQNDAIRAWNLSVALYYKSSNIPWQPADLSAGSCFIGISFHHLKRRGGDILYASLAQAFSTDTEPFALQGETLPDRQIRDKQPYLLANQAENIVRKVVQQYRARTGTMPSRVVIHKSSLYQPEEIEGFNSGCGGQVPSCDMIWMKPTGFRLLRKGDKEVERGMLASVEDQKLFLFTTGYVDWWREYPGPHIPAPLEIGAATKADMVQSAQEIMSLTKMNWNSADGMGRHPITLSFARQVGAVMTEIEDEREINPLYRFYM
ncbi:MAG: helix-turn-helix domain-containing protein [Dechloromonas sp.]|nr:MAG: helix-turn-helix domain-containing protein [Dechloromonas sp.]